MSEPTLDRTFKRVFRVDTTDSTINAAIEREWEKGGALVQVIYPAGMHWAILVFSYPEMDS